MKKGKAPGIDGLTLDLYLECLDLIGPFLLELYNHAFNEGVLNKTAKRGLMILIPKKGYLREMKNQHQITLLCIAYKIVATVLALRMRQVLPHIIRNEQTGFMPGGRIQSNIRRTIDLIAHVNHTGKRALVVSINFEKYFYRIEHHAIYGMLLKILWIQG